MKITYKRSLGILLALVLVLSAGLPAYAVQEDGKSVFFDNTASWSFVYYYYWSDEDPSMISWPGEPMTLLSGSVYQAMLPADAQYVIFHNTLGTQTADLEFPGPGMIYTYASGEWEIYSGCNHEWDWQVVAAPGCETPGQSEGTCIYCGTGIADTVDALGHQYVNGTCTRCGSPEPQGMSIYVDDGFGWDEVWVHWWNDENSSQWPGLPMTKLANGAYRAEIPYDATGVVFNDGLNIWQSLDLVVPGEDYIYYATIDYWEPYGDHVHRLGELKCYQEASCMEEGIYAIPCQTCEVEYTMYEPAMGHTYENDACVFCGMEKPENYVIYLDVADVTTDPMVYYWSREEDIEIAWPGIPMTHEDGNVYSAVLPTEADYLIFTGEKNSFQTVDMVIPGTNQVFSIVDWAWTEFDGCFHRWEDHQVLVPLTCYSNGEFIDTCILCGATRQYTQIAMGHQFENGACTVCGLLQPESYTLYYGNEGGWQTPYFYYWSDDDNAMSLWPGEPMIRCDNGMYVCQVPGEATHVIFNNGGNGWQTCDLPIPGDGYLFGDDGWMPYAPVGVTLSGTVTSYGDDQAQYAVYLWQGSQIADYAIVTGNSASYQFNGVTPGTYILQILKDDHITRTYTVNVAGEPVVQNVQICLIADVNADGRVNLGDVARAFAHVRGKNLTTDEYTKQCADVNEDGKINIGDVARIYSHARNKSKLF